MVSTKIYTPRRGDEVLAQGQSGTFRVEEIDASERTVVLRLIGATEYPKVGIPWGGLTLVKRKGREDFSQAAARIVREATERD